MSYSKEDIIRMVKEEDVEFIRLQFTDIFGQLKNVAITASQIEKAVNDQVMFDGSSIEGFVRIDESDQYLYPDLDSFAIFPWRPSHGRVARLICDVHDPDGKPFVGDPRHVLKRALKRAEEMGFDAFNVGPEAEFFLFQTDDEGKPTTRTNDEAGYFDLGRGRPPPCAMVGGRLLSGAYRPSACLPGQLRARADRPHGHALFYDGKGDRHQGHLPTGGVGHHRPLGVL